MAPWRISDSIRGVPFLAACSACCHAALPTLTFASLLSPCCRRQKNSAYFRRACGRRVGRFRGAATSYLLTVAGKQAVAGGKTVICSCVHLWTCSVRLSRILRTHACTGARASARAVACHAAYLFRALFSLYSSRLCAAVLWAGGFPAAPAQRHTALLPADLLRRSGGSPVLHPAERGAYVWRDNASALARLRLGVNFFVYV